MKKEGMFPKWEFPGSCSLASPSVFKMKRWLEQEQTVVMDEPAMENNKSECLP